MLVLYQITRIVSRPLPTAPFLLRCTPALQVVKPGLCLVSGGTRRLDGYPSLTLADCGEYPGPGMSFTLKYNSSSAGHLDPQQIMQDGTGLCVTALSFDTLKPGVVVLKPCTAGKDATQQWIFGTSGRFCQHYKAADHVCLTLLPPSLARTSFVQGR